MGWFWQGVSDFLADEAAADRAGLPRYQDLENAPNYNTVTSDDKTPTPALTVPQWNWNTEQSKEWLFNVCTSHFSMTKYDAKTVVGRFDGCGITLFLLKSGNWAALLGGTYRGVAVDAFIKENFHAEGAAPKRLRIREDGVRVWDDEEPKTTNCQSCGPSKSSKEMFPHLSKPKKVEADAGETTEESSPDFEGKGSCGTTIL